MNRTVTGLVLVVFVLLSTVVPGLAAGDPSIEATTSIETPPRTVSVGGSEFTVSSIGVVDNGADLSYSVSPGDAQEFSVILYNSEKQKVDHLIGTSGGTYSFPTDALDAGTYTLALSIDGVITDIHPVVVSGFEFIIDGPDHIAEDDYASITAQITQASTEPNRLEVAVMNDTYRDTFTMARVESNTYNRVISGLDTGTYRYYIGVRGTDQVNGEDELIGISSVQRLDVGSPTDQTTTTTSSTTTDSSTTTSDSSTLPSGTTTAETTSLPTTGNSTSTSQTATTVSDNGTGTTVSVTTPNQVGTSDPEVTSPTTDQETTAPPVSSTPIQPETSQEPRTSANAPGLSITWVVVSILLAVWIRGSE